MGRDPGRLDDGIAQLPSPAAPPGVRAPTEVDVAADGSMVVNTLYGDAFGIDPAGVVTPIGLVGEWGFGAAFSVRQDRAYFGRWDVGHPEIFVSDRSGDGGWGPLTSWSSVPSSGALSGFAVDACDHLYAVDERCHVYRVDPDGVAELLVDLNPFLGGLRDCRSLAFGRGLGGWDAYRPHATSTGDCRD